MSTGQTLSESSSKALLSSYGLVYPAEHVVGDVVSAVDAAEQVGYPVVAKLVGDRIAHKSERGLVKLGLGDGPSVERAVRELLAAVRDDDGDVGVLIAPMISGHRELIVGMIRDPQFGATVMLGVGG
ncbi:MAG: acetate--CoA ligase family protein, partial [Ilumatobacteraceae bacterium]